LQHRMGPLLRLPPTGGRDSLSSQYLTSASF
jgi:hypothetical protein